jgi:hypothetical protein
VSPGAASDLPGRGKQNILQHPESGCCLSAALYSSLLSLFENLFYSGNVLEKTGNAGRGNKIEEEKLTC